MMVKQVVSEEPVLLSEVKEVLARSPEPRDEMKYEKKRALEHAEAFVKMEAGKAAALARELAGLEKIKPHIAHRIADLLPATRDEVRALYAKERFNLSDAELDKIVEIVKKHR
ncbi:MAG: RNA polymerase Rpb4 family protein [Halobacteria archaeon]